MNQRKKRDSKMVTNKIKMREEIVNTFLELVKIPSPSGYELNVANYIKKYLITS